MSITVVKDELKEYLSDYARETLTPSKPKGFYVCPFCGSGNQSHANSDSAFHITEHNGKKIYKCFSCHRSGDIFDLCQHIEHVDIKGAMNSISRKYRGASCSTSKKDSTSSIKQEVDYTEYFNSVSGNIENCNYLDSRGISKEVQRCFNIGYVEQWKHPNSEKSYPSSRLIIPTSKSSYIARATDTNNNIKVMKVGNVHLFNSEALSGTSTENYCFIVEGEIDALSCIEVNCNALGLGGTSNINLLFKDKHLSKNVVLILALDNDQAGTDCKEKLIELCNQHHIVYYLPNVNQLFDGEKDANDLLKRDRSLLEKNLQVVRDEALKININSFYSNDPIGGSGTLMDKPIPEPAELQQSKNNTVTLPYYFYENKKGEICVSASMLAEYIRKNSHYIFVRNQATEGVNRFWYKHGCYCPVSDDELKGYIKTFITKYNVSLLKMRDVYEVFNDLITDLQFVKGEQLNDNENIINFQNGLLFLDTMELKPHTPDIYSTIQIPCNWNPGAISSPIFDDFLDTLTEGSEEKKTFLMQYMGVCISNLKGCRLKKSLFMVGKGDTGKSQLKGLTERLVGTGNCSSITLSELEKRFGTSNIYNRRMAGDSDMSFMAVKELKMFKQLTGGDSVPIEFKNKTPFNYVYNGVLWFCMNELPKFGGDRGQWVYDRIIVMHCDNVIPKDKQDKLLLDKMFIEREAIVFRAVQALKTVIQNGINFSIPECCMLENKQYQKDNDPVQMFFDECCIPREKGKGYDNCTTKKTYDVFKEWCKDNNNNYVIQKQEFNKSLMGIFNVSNIKDLYVIVNGTRYFKFTLTAEAKNEYRLIYGYDNIQADTQ